MLPTHAIQPSRNTMHAVRALPAVAEEGKKSERLRACNRYSTSARAHTTKYACVLFLFLFFLVERGLAERRREVKRLN